jgi:hypothetical protein
LNMAIPCKLFLFYFFYNWFLDSNLLGRIIWEILFCHACYVFQLWTVSTNFMRSAVIRVKYLP